ECGTCYYCSDTCRSGQKSVSCSSTYNKVRVSSTECGTSCYECQYNTDCSVTSKSCSYGCASTNSCGKCTSCKSKPPVSCTKYYSYRSGSAGSGGGSITYVTYTYDVTCKCSDGSSHSLGTETRQDGCWDCDDAHRACKAACGSSCYHSNPTYNSIGNILNYATQDICAGFSEGSC
ncbi:MAG: hypothetical protein IJ479_07890, partial [Alphaproteobacteria bacterium]|nr:hypothetical protein [Alphaproteobacteria bacterium]